MKIECTDFKTVSKGTLQGFAKFYFPDLFLEINSCSLHMKDGKRWINFPQKENVDKDGNKKFYSYILFPEKDRYQEFQIKAKNAIDDYCKKISMQSQQDLPTDDLPF